MIQLIVMLMFVGVALWLINTYVPMAAPIKTILNVVVILCVLLYLLSIFGLMDIPLPRHR